MPKIVSLAIHPVKSCSAIEVEEMRVSARGPLFDRQWMVVDAKSHTFLTQRQLTRMALVKTRLTEHELELIIPGSEDHSLKFSTEKTHAQHPIQVRIWNDDCQAIDEGDDAAEQLSQYLGHEVRMVRMQDGFERRLPEKYAHPLAHTAFADQHPFLLTSMDSLEDLNTRLGNPSIPMNRFRANIIVEGALAFAEDNWKTIRIHGVEFDIAKPCARCMIVNTDQENAERGVEPLKTLARYRRDENGKVLFGQYLIHRSEGIIRVGDEVQVVS